MLVSTNSTAVAGLAQKRAIAMGLLICVAIVVAAIAFSEPLLELVRRWRVQEEYSHGFIIPVLAAWLLWSRRAALLANLGRPSWTGILLILIAAVLQVVGKLSALVILPQLGFIIVLFGIALCVGGYRFLKVAFIPIVYLVFAIPLPYFIDAALSFRLQLISSQLGVFFIRLLQIPVYLEGNVIDFGVYKLQVVEACSGLRYLYPLLSLGFLAAYLFRGPLLAAGVGVSVGDSDYHRDEQSAHRHRRRVRELLGSARCGRRTPHVRRVDHLCRLRWPATW